MHPFIISIFIFVIALPCATFILFRILGRIAFQDLILLSSTIGPLFITYSVFVLGYIGLLSRHNLLLISVAIFVIPLLTRDVRSIILSTFRVRVRVFHKNIKNLINNLSTLDAFMLSLVISLIILTIPSAFTLPPVLRDPYAVWLFYGKKIAETSIIPLFYGNAPDISWSGNYPPMISFMAAYYFILLNRVDPTFNHISWLYSVLLLLSTYYLAKEIGIGRSPIIAVFMLTTSSLFTLSLVNYGYTTVVWAFYITVSIYYLVRFMNTKNPRLALLFGIGLGAGLLTTYLSLFFVTSILFTSVLIKIFKSNGILNLKHLFFGLNIGIIILVPWLVRNVALLGNPIYPWFYNIFSSSKGIDPEVMKLIPQPKYDVRSLLIDNTFHGLANEDIGYAILMYGLAASIYYSFRNKHSTVTYVSVLTLTFFVTLLLSMVIYYGYERYLLMVAPLFSTLAGKLISTIFSTSRVNFKILTAYSLIVFSLPSYGYTISLIDGVSPSDTQALSIIQKYLDAYASSNSTILTNEIALFFIDQKVINMYNLPELFRYKTLNILFEILKHHNIDYVLINITIDSNTFERISNDLTILANKGVIRKLIELHPYTLYEVQNNE
jgi:hypothetical protein